MLLVALKVSVVLAAQLTASFTSMSPLTPPPCVDEMVTLFDSSCWLSAAPVMSPPDAATVKPSGSMIQSPLAPFAAFVVMTALSAIFTFSPLVSITPPLPPLGAEASSVPGDLGRSARGEQLDLADPHRSLRGGAAGEIGERARLHDRRYC